MIIRQPYGPDGTNGFCIREYNIVPVKINELDYVVPYARLPKQYLIHEKCIGKIREDYIFYDVYITNDYVICFYRNKNELYQYYDLKKNDIIISKKIINHNYYLIINNISISKSRMFRFKNINSFNNFWNKLKEIHLNK